MPRLAKQAHRLQPPEHFLDALAEPLAHCIAGVARGARVEGSAFLLRHVRRHVERADTLDEVPVVIVLAGAAGGAGAPTNLAAPTWSDARPPTGGIRAPGAHRGCPP